MRNNKIKRTRHREELPLVKEYIEFHGGKFVALLATYDTMLQSTEYICLVRTKGSKSTAEYLFGCYEPGVDSDGKTYFTEAGMFDIYTDARDVGEEYVRSCNETYMEGVEWENNQ